MTSPDSIEPGRGTPLMMVRPAAFGFDEETAVTNRFQERGAGETGAGGVAALARDEFDGLVRALREAGVEVLAFEDTPDPPRPSSVFPNNWISFHGDGTVVLYPMATESRRLEVRPEWIEELAATGFRVERTLDLRVGATGRALEGTGSLVLDRDRRLAFAALSPRTDPELVRAFAEELDYEPVTFRAEDPGGVPVYHTNVVLSVGPSVALACFDCIPDPAERALLREHLLADDRLVIELNWDQILSFAGNALEVSRAAQRPALVLSAAAHSSLTPEQLEALEQRVDPISSPLTTIERLGGGSARCMVAAIHLPRSDAKP